MRTGRTMELKRFLTAGLIVALLIPLFFGGVRSVEAVSPIYVDHDWEGLEAGTDPDGAGPATSFGTDSFATITEGVAVAVDGDTVQVYAGTYVEQIHIAQSITLTGENKLTTIIQAPTLMDQDCTSPQLTNSPIICVNGGKSPTIQGFTIDGLATAATHIRLMGIALRNAGGIIQDNIIKNICFDTDLDPQCDPNGANEGVGIYVYNTDTLVRNVDIHNNLIYDFNKNGITVTTSNNSGNRTEFTVSANTIDGMVGESGLYNSTVAQNGIQIAVPSGGGIIQGNNISKIAHNNNGKPPYVAVSILTISTPVDTLDNIITGAQAGIVYLNDTEDVGNYREISGNIIEVFKPGTLANPGQNVYGILVTDRSKDILSPVDPPAILNSLNAQLNGGPLYVLVNDNTVIYTGALPNTKTFGIEIDAAVGENYLTVDVLRNQIGALNDGFDVGLAFYQCGPDNLPPDPTITDCGMGSLENSRVVNNNISGNNNGVFAVGPVGQSKLDDFHHNRIAGNGVGFQNDTGLDILAINNWWGCNEGPGAPGCDTLINNIDPAFADPWLTLTATMDPLSVPSGTNSIMTASLDINSNAENTSAPNTGPVSTTANFSANLGTFTPTSTVFADGDTVSTYRAPAQPGTDQVCVTVDNAVVCHEISVLPPFITSTDLAGPYTVGVSREFHVTLDNTGGTEYTNVLAHFRILSALSDDIASLEYFETFNDTWYTLPLTADGSDLVGAYGPVTGFPMPSGYTATSLFRVTFNTARTYDVVISLSDLSPDPDVTLASFTATAVVEAPQSFDIFLPLISN